MLSGAQGQRVGLARLHQPDVLLNEFGRGEFLLARDHGLFQAVEEFVSLDLGIGIRQLNDFVDGGKLAVLDGLGTAGVNGVGHGLGLRGIEIEGRGETPLCHKTLVGIKGHIIALVHEAGERGVAFPLPQDVDVVDGALCTGGNRSQQ